MQSIPCVLPRGSPAYIQYSAYNTQVACVQSAFCVQCVGCLPVCILRTLRRFPAYSLYPAYITQAVCIVCILCEVRRLPAYSLYPAYITQAAYSLFSA